MLHRVKFSLVKLLLRGEAVDASGIWSRRLIPRARSGLGPLYLREQSAKWPSDIRLGDRYWPTLLVRRARRQLPLTNPAFGVEGPLSGSVSNFRFRPQAATHARQLDDSKVAHCSHPVRAFVRQQCSMTGRSPVDTQLTVSAPLRSLSHPACIGAYDRYRRYC